MDAGEVRVRIEADASDLQSGVDSAKHKLDELAKKADELSSKMDGLSNKSQSVGRGVSDLGNAAHDAGGKVGTLSTKADDAATHAQNAGAKVADAGKQIDAIKQKDAGLSWQGILAGDKAAQALSGSLKGLGSTLTKGLTVPLVAIGGISAKSAVEFESSFAGVRKTVDATEEEFQQLSKAARDMAQTKPVDVNDINLIMELGGQLGVAKDALGKFADVVSDLDVSTNMNVEEASTQLAQFMNITGQSYDNVDRLGATIVALGNNSATTEADIMNMAMRIAGAGHGIGLTDDQILALSASLSSVGIEAEAGGTAISTIMSTIDKEVATNGDTLDAWAKAAGMSASEFKSAWASDTMGTIQKVFSGIGESGENLNLILEDLGIDSIRQTDLMKRMSSASQILSNSVEIANKGWQENTALVNEASRRYKTNESKMQMAANKAKDVAITLGGPLADALSGAIDAAEPLIKGVADLAQGFADLDKPTQQQIIKWGLIAAAAGPVISKFGDIVDKVGKIKGAFDDMRGDKKLGELEKKSQSAQKSLSALSGESDTARKKIDTLGSSAEKSTAKVTTASEKSAKSVEKIGTKAQAASGAVQSSAKTAASSFDTITTSAESAGGRVEASSKKAASSFSKISDGATSASATINTASGNAEKSVGRIGAAAEKVKGKVGALSGAIMGFSQMALAGALFVALDTVIQKYSEYIAYQNDVTKATKGVSDAVSMVGGKVNDMSSALDSVPSKSDDATGALDRLRDSASKTASKNADFAQSLKDAFASTDTNNQVVQTYADKIEELAGKCGGSAEKIGDLKTAVSEYNKLTGDNIQVIDDVTGRLDVSTDRIKANTDAWIANAWAQASKDKLTEAMKTQIDTHKALEDAEADLAKVEAENTAGTGRYEVQRARANSRIEEAKKKVEDLKTQDEAAGKAVEDLANLSSEYAQKAEAATKSATDFAGALNKATGDSNSFAALADKLGYSVDDLSQKLADSGVSAQQFADLGADQFARLLTEAGGDIDALGAKLITMEQFNIDPKTVTINDDGTITTTGGRLVDLNNQTIDGKHFTVNDDGTISIAGTNVDHLDWQTISDKNFTVTEHGSTEEAVASLDALNALGIDPKYVNVWDDGTITTTDGKLVDLNNMTIDGKSFTVSDGQTIQENTDEVNAFDDVPIGDKIWEVDNGGSVGDNTTEVDTLTGSINAIPTEPSFTVTGEVEAAQTKTSSLLDTIGSIAGKTFTYFINAVTGGNASGGISNASIKEIPRHASGGFKIANKPTLTNVGWVGEDGAEAIIPLTNRRYVRPFARAVASEVNANLGAHIASDISGAVGSYVDTQYRTLTASNAYIARLGSAALKDASGNKYALNALAYTQSSVSDAIAKMSREIDEQSKSFESGANSFIKSLESGASSQSASLHSLEDVVKKVKEQAVSIGATLTDMAASDKEAYNNLYMLWGDLTDFHYDFNWYAERANAALGAEAYATGGISPVPLKSIPAHAKGGFKLATRPTLTNIGWVGEDGAEAIVPLTNRRYVRPFAGAVASEVGSSIGNRVAGVTTASIADYADKRFSAVDIAIARYQQEAETSNNIQASAISAISLSQKAAKNVYDETLAVARYIKTVFSSLSDSAYDSAVSLGEISKCLEAMAEADKSAYTNQYMMWGDLTDFHYDFNWYAERANAALGAEENARGGISSHAIKEIPAHAKGGFKVANRATLTNVGWVGEDGAEAIVPLSNRRYVRPFANAVATEVDSSLGSHVANSVVSGMASYTDGQFSALDVAVARYAKSAEVADELQTTALNAITLTQQAAEGVYKQTLQVTSNIETMLGAAGTKIKETADGVTTIKDTLAKMAEADTQAYSNQYMMWGDLTDFHYDFNWYAERANAALGAEENATGGIFRHSIKEIPAHAKGGFKVANKPTLTNVGWVGEDGSEAIVPLSNRRYVRPFASAVAAEVDGGLGSKISGDVVGALASYTDGQFSALDLAVARYSKNTETAQELQTTALNAITLTQQAAENVYKQTLQVTSNIETVLGAVGTKIKEMADNITAMKDTLSAMASADEQAYSNQYMMWGDLTDFHYDFNWYAERANAALGAEAYATGGISPVPLKAIPANARGGFKVANKPTLTNVGWVGEDGTEAIVPLSNRKYVRPFASAVAAEVSEFVSSSAAQKLAYGIAPYIASNIGAAQMANNQIQQTGAAQVASTESLKPILTELLGAVKDVGSQVAQVNVNVAGADMTTPMDVRQLSMQLANHTASQMRAKGVLR